MIKTIYIVRGSKHESYADFKNRMFSIISIIESKYLVSSLKIVLTEKAAPLISIIPFKRKKIAIISILGEKDQTINEIEEEAGFSGKYTVKEALPVSYSKTWKDGEATPGICLLTLFNQKKNISHAVFIDRWHNGHTPLSLKIHPLWNYNRNVVENNESNNKEKWDGIVEEHFKEKSDLLNVFTFFGKPQVIIQNMIIVYRDTKSFIDYPSMQTYLAMEYHFKS
jgi:hypothetical protein